MDKKINLSFVITTRNRLESLKVILEDIISGRQEDEEIIVIDAQSNDGTSQFLKEQHQNRKIQKLLIEPDKCQAEGWNKGFLLSSGELIKKITDDDIFDLEAIRSCKAYMLNHPEFDVCISNELFTDHKIYPQFNKHSFFEGFSQWRRKKTDSFFFSDPHMLIRRRELAYFGFYNPRFIMIDYEYSLRISYLQARIVYYTGYNSMSYFREETVSGLINEKTLNQEYRISNQLYNYKLANKSKWNVWRFKVSVFIKGMIFTKSKESVNNTSIIPFSEKYLILKKSLTKLNSGNKTFISNV